MKKLIEKILFILPIVLVICFTFFVYKDWSNYCECTSTPFYLYIIIRALEFILPAAISVFISLLLRKKRK